MQELNLRLVNQLKAFFPDAKMLEQSDWCESRHQEPKTGIVSVSLMVSWFIVAVGNFGNGGFI